MHDPEAGARRMVEAMATTWGASLVVRHGDPAVADAWLSSRVGGNHGSLYGTLDPGLDIGHLARRAVPVG